MQKALNVKAKVSLYVNYADDKARMSIRGKVEKDKFNTYSILYYIHSKQVIVNCKLQDSNLQVFEIECKCLFYTYKHYSSLHMIVERILP